MAEIVCPECHTRFRTGRDLAGESVSCARCGAVFVVEPAGAVREEPEETPRPVSRMPRPRVMEKKKKKKKKETTKKPAGKKKGRRVRKGPLLPMPLLVALGVGLFAVVLWMFVPGLSNAIRKGPGAVLSRIGVGDSAASLNREVTAVFVEAREVLASVKDAASGQAAVGRIKELNGRLVDIQRRAMSAPSVTPAELQEIANPSSRMAEAEAARKEMERIAAGNLATRELGDELSKFTRLLSAAGSAASTGLMLADARNEYDEIEREHVEIIKRVSLAILSANDAAALDRAASVCEAGTRELKALVERRERAGGSKLDIASALDRYRQARNGANAGTFDHTFSLAERGIQSAARRTHRPGRGK